MFKKAIFGLGNPGDRYNHTRHNIGVQAVQAYVRTTPKRVNPEADGFSLVYRLEPYLLIIPQTYMNLSGVAVKDILDTYALLPENCLIVYDDVSLPFGHLRLRESGGAGGQKGMASVIEQLQTKAIPRLRIGIDDGAVKTNLSEFVLEDFSAKEGEKLPLILGRTSQAICAFLEENMHHAMNLYNGSAL